MNKKEIMSSFIEIAVNMFKDYITSKEVKHTQKNENGITISARVSEITRKQLTYNNQLENEPYIIEVINCTEYPIENINVFLIDGKKSFITIPTLKANETYPLEVGRITVDERNAPNGFIRWGAEQNEWTIINKNNLKDFMPIIGKEENGYKILLSGISGHLDLKAK